MPGIHRMKTELTSWASRAWEKNLWNFLRFGLIPGKVVSRVLPNREQPNILCICIPKAGTHLLERILCLHPHLYRKLLPTINNSNIHRWGGFPTLLKSQKPGQILFAHLNFSKEYLSEIKSLNTKAILLIRDPRDIVISQAFYVAKNKKHHLHDQFVGRDLRTQIKLATAGIPGRGYPSIGERLAHYAGWLESSVCHILRFEDLRSDDKVKQHETIRALFMYLQSEISDEEIHMIRRRMVTHASPTFRRGTVGQWRDHFDTELEIFFNEVAGDMLTKYDYPRDYK